MDIFFLFTFFILVLVSSFSFVLPTNSAFFACLFSLFFFILLLITKRIKKLPHYVLITLFVITLTFLLSIFINSVDQLRGYGSLFLWSSYILFFTISTQIHLSEKQIYWSFLTFTIACVVLFALRSFFPSLLPFIQASDRQFILPSTGMHNHLGDIIGLGLISILFITSSSRVASVARFIFLPLIVLSFTKSALLSLFIVLIISGIRIKERRGNLLYTAFILFYIGVAAVVVFSQEFSSVSFVAPIQKYLQTGFNLSPKPLLSQRDVYSYQAGSFLFNSSFEYAGFGLGLGNFPYAASKTTNAINSIVADPHNILLTYFVEGGVIALLWTIVFFGLVCYYGVKYKKGILFLFLYLLLLFQTDYLYKIPAFMFLFFFLAGQTVRNPKEDEETSHSFDLWLWISIFITTLFVGFQAYTTKVQYSLQQRVLTKSLEQNNIEDIGRSAGSLYSITPYDETLLIRLSSIYEAHDQKDKAIFFLEKLLAFYPHNYIENGAHLLKLKAATNQNVSQYLSFVIPELKKTPLSKKEKGILNSLCRQYISSECFK